MCKAIEEYADKRAIKDVIDELRVFGVTNEQIAERIKIKYNLSDDQIAAYLKTE